MAEKLIQTYKNSNEKMNCFSCIVCMLEALDEGLCYKFGLNEKADSCLELPMLPDCHYASYVAIASFHAVVVKDIRYS